MRSMCRQTKGGAVDDGIDSGYHRRLTSRAHASPFRFLANRSDGRVTGRRLPAGQPLCRIRTVNGADTPSITPVPSSIPAHSRYGERSDSYDHLNRSASSGATIRNHFRPAAVGRPTHRRHQAGQTPHRPPERPSTARYRVQPLGGRQRPPPPQCGGFNAVDSLPAVIGGAASAVPPNSS